MPCVYLNEPGNGDSSIMGFLIVALIFAEKFFEIPLKSAGGLFGGLTGGSSSVMC